MSRFLSDEDVEGLTGYKLASFQLKWCRTHGVQAWLSAQNKVKIPVAAIEGRKAENDSAWSPDYSGLRRQA